MHVVGEEAVFYQPFPYQDEMIVVYLIVILDQDLWQHTRMQLVRDRRVAGRHPLDRNKR
jgi:hypothetical protein